MEIEEILDAIAEIKSKEKAAEKNLALIVSRETYETLVKETASINTWYGITPPDWRTFMLWSTMGDHSLLFGGVNMYPARRGKGFMIVDKSMITKLLWNKGEKEND